MSPDRIRFSARLNEYGYAGSEPVNGVDPSGLLVTPADGAVLLADGYFFSRSAGQHDFGGSLVNGAVFVADAFLSAIPYVPPAAGEGRLLLTLAVEDGRVLYARLGGEALENLIRGWYFSRPLIGREREEACARGPSPGHRADAVTRANRSCPSLRKARRGKPAGPATAPSLWPAARAPPSRRWSCVRAVGHRNWRDARPRGTAR